MTLTSMIALSRTRVSHLFPNCVYNLVTFAATALSIFYSRFGLRYFLPIFFPSLLFNCWCCCRFQFKFNHRCWKFKFRTEKKIENEEKEMLLLMMKKRHTLTLESSVFLYFLLSLLHDNNTKWEEKRNIFIFDIFNTLFGCLFSVGFVIVYE